jgi:hypothetical protein
MQPWIFQLYMIAERLAGLTGLGESGLSQPRARCRACRCLALCPRRGAEPGTTSNRSEIQVAGRDHRRGPSARHVRELGLCRSRPADGQDQAWTIKPAAAPLVPWSRFSCHRPLTGITGSNCCCAAITSASRSGPWPLSARWHVSYRAALPGGYLSWPCSRATDPSAAGRELRARRKESLDPLHPTGDWAQILDQVVNAQPDYLHHVTWMWLFSREGHAASARLSW